MSRRGACLTGFDGKLPSRGDFVGAGLPLSFLTPWRLWVERVLQASRLALGDAWVPAWLEAPVWHFACASGTAGPDAVLGLMFPSIDRAGRHYPMTIAAVFPAFAGLPGGELSDAWRTAAEAAGLAALADDGEPAVLADVLASLDPPVARSVGVAGTAWQSAGSPRVANSRIVLPALPAAQDFARMIAGDSCTP